MFPPSTSRTLSRPTIQAVPPMMRICGLHTSSLDPSALSADVEEKLSCIVLEVEAYVAEHCNAITTYSKTCEGNCIQICGLHPSSLDLPMLSTDDEATAEEKLSYVLLEVESYVAER
ncbi:hypothetical protein BAE44_0002350 [Dichanthelium oligosanthes]|uniref:Uncharacterized protein n=1 Tax=Dichanthelium oligosanthes TaxID=888268 RepID=A0A1E5WGX6_9POAL|nr:hypothetical protein BAE44_0002350 [Dichanthelium oligosanthes]